jgi:hypothetical protein
MKKKNLRTLIIPLLLLTPLIISNQYDSSVKAWGIPTHLYIAEETLDLINGSWEEAFGYYGPEVTGGSGYPDQVLQDWQNHLYYPTTGQHNAPFKITQMVGEIRAFASNEEWDNVFFYLGVMSHYTADINIPVHTWDSWDGHNAYEDDISYNLDSLNVTPHTFESITNVTDFIINCSWNAYNYYWDIYNAYPTTDTSGVVLSNSTIKAITEEQLGRAIGAVYAVWNYTLSTVTPPIITEVPDVAKVLVDRYHGNDYAADDELTSFVDTLDRDVLKVIYNDYEINATSLAGVDLLVICAPITTTGFTANELTAISNWYAAGGHILLSSRGDYTYDVSFEGMNALLAAIDSDIRVNDDNLYTSPADPEYYQDWYCYTGNYNLDPAVASITASLTRRIRFFSPSSLYEEAGGDNVNWLIYGEDYFYQADEASPGPAVVYDMTDDDVGGDIIPIAGIEVEGDSSIAVFGSTIWSDYDYGLTDKDNKYFTYETIEYLLGIDLESDEDYVPAPTETTTPTPPPTTPSPTETPYPALGIFAFALLAAISIKLRNRKKN